MQDKWFYAADDEETVGPLSLKHLIVLLKKMPDPKNALVWHPALSDWHRAADVPQIADTLFIRTASSASRTTSTAGVTRSRDTLSKKPSPNNPYRWLALIGALVVALFVGAGLSTFIYGNSPDGIGHVLGYFVGVILLISLISVPWRKAKNAPAMVVLISTALVILGHGTKLFDALDARQAQAALKNVPDPAKMGDALKENSQNALLQLIVEAKRLADESATLVDKLSSEIEPAGLNKAIDPATATKDELSAFISNLRIAQAKAAQAMSRYDEIMKIERKKIEQFAQSLRLSDDLVRSMLSGVDKRQSASAAFTSKMMNARAELYRALEDVYAIFLAQFGAYRVINGQIQFASQSATAQYLTASRALSEKAGRIEELDRERIALMRAQQEGWERFVRSGGDKP